MDQKNLADLYNLPPIPWSVALDGTRVGRKSEPDVVPHHDTARRPAARRRSRRHVGQRQGLRRERRGDAQEQEPRPRSQLRRRDVAQRASTSSSRAQAAKVTDDETLKRLAKRYGDSGWPARVEDGAFTYDYSAPSAGPPPWDLYAITPTTVFGVLGEEPGGATRWRFEA